jgi:hypothetical protein
MILENFLGNQKQEIINFTIETIFNGYLIKVKFIEGDDLDSFCIKKLVLQDKEELETFLLEISDVMTDFYTEKSKTKFKKNDDDKSDLI